MKQILQTKIKNMRRNWKKSEIIGKPGSFNIYLIWLKGMVIVSAPGDESSKS